MVGIVLATRYHVIGENDGRCVRAPEPASGELSTLSLLLNPPSECLFQATLRELSVSDNVAHFFLLRTLRLDLTFWALPILLTAVPSQDKLATVVYKRNEQEVVRLNGGYRL